jgi:excisionase family DNA binding protein
MPKPVRRKPAAMYRDWDEVPLANTVVEAGAVLRRSRESVFALIRSGELPSVKVGGRRLITKAALRAYLDDGLNGDPP